MSERDKHPLYIIHIERYYFHMEIILAISVFAWTPEFHKNMELAK